MVEIQPRSKMHRGAKKRMLKPVVATVRFVGSLSCVVIEPIASVEDAEENGKGCEAETVNSCVTLLAQFRQLLVCHRS